jgi:hypothetical protein
MDHRLVLSYQQINMNGRNMIDRTVVMVYSLLDSLHKQTIYFGGKSGRV